MIKLTNQAVNAQITNSSMSLQELAVWQDRMLWPDYRHKTSFKGKRKIPQQLRKVVKKQCKCLLKVKYVYSVFFRSVTWMRDSHGLFDYESRNISKKNYKTKFTGQIIRQQNQVDFISPTQKIEEL